MFNVDSTAFTPSPACFVLLSVDRASSMRTSLPLSSTDRSASLTPTRWVTWTMRSRSSFSVHHAEVPTMSPACFVPVALGVLGRRGRGFWEVSGEVCVAMFQN